MNIALAVFGILILIASYVAYVMGLALVSLLFYKFITRNRIAKRQVIVVCSAMAAILISIAIIAIAKDANFGAEPGEPPLDAEGVVLQLVGFLSFITVVGCIVARLTQK